MNRKPKAGLLPLYLALYDDLLPEMRKVLEPFLAQVRGGLVRTGIEVVSAPVCRLTEEFDGAIAGFERASADVIVTLHLAYSPSLQSLDALLRTKLPVVVCDTTMDHDFGQSVPFERMLYNHGVHGVMDTCSMLRRRGKPFAIAAGHLEKSDVLARTAELARAAYAARRLREMKVLRIGEIFKGMGDFAVPDELLKSRLGVQVDQINAEDLASIAHQIGKTEIDDEIAADRHRYHVTAPEEVHQRSVRVGLALRRALEQGRYGAFSFNFLAFDTAEEPINAVPFLEASKAMDRGIGYAGEGDTFTAALVGALCAGFGDTTFTEIFCPDWKGNSLFLSHMGEVNPGVLTEATLYEKPYVFTKALNPAIVTGPMRPGPAAFVNLTQGPNESFELLLSEVEVLPDSQDASMQQQVRGWIRPKTTVANFLRRYSELGGTHHNALVLGDRLEPLRAFAKFAGLECHVF